MGYEQSTRPLKNISEIIRAQPYNSGDDHSSHISEIDEHNVCEALGPDRLDTTMSSQAEDLAVFGRVRFPWCRNL